MKVKWHESKDERGNSVWEIKEGIFEAKIYLDRIWEAEVRLKHPLFTAY